MLGKWIGKRSAQDLRLASMFRLSGMPLFTGRVSVPMGRLDSGSLTVRCPAAAHFFSRRLKQWSCVGLNDETA